MKHMIRESQARMKIVSESRCKRWALAQPDYKSG